MSDGNSRMRWLNAVLVGPGLSAAVWAMFVTWARDRQLYLFFSLACAFGACFVAAVVGPPFHILMRRRGKVSWMPYAIFGGLLGLGMYFLSWLFMSLAVNDMDLAPAVT